MRTLIGWTAALLASALAGAVMYVWVFSDPVVQPVAESVARRMTADPVPRETLVRTEVREVVEPAPTVTVEEVVVLQAPAQPAAQQRAEDRAPAPTRKPRHGGDDRGERAESDDDSQEAESEDKDEHEDEKDDHAEEDEHEEDD